MNSLVRVLRAWVPYGMRNRLQRVRRATQHRLMPFRRISDFGRLRTLEPISRQFGWDRGLPIDRWYIERFLGRYADDVRGHVLEIQNDTYARHFGRDAVERCDVLDVTDRNPLATLVADLAETQTLPEAMFDCIICTQTLLLIFDVRQAVASLHRMLKPGGVLLATAPGIGHRAVRDASGQRADYWRFTALSFERLFRERFPADALQVESFGNVVAAIAFTHGLAADELCEAELQHLDSDFEVAITLRAVKPLAGDR